MEISKLREIPGYFYLHRMHWYECQESNIRCRDSSLVPEKREEIKPTLKLSFFSPDFWPCRKESQISQDSDLDKIDT